MVVAGFRVQAVPVLRAREQVVEVEDSRQSTLPEAVGALVALAVVEQLTTAVTVVEMVVRVFTRQSQVLRLRVAEAEAEVHSVPAEDNLESAEAVEQAQSVGVRTPAEAEALEAREVPALSCSPFLQSCL